MLRCIILLLIYGLLAIADSSVIRENNTDSLSMPVRCTSNSNLKQCVTKKMEKNEDQRSQSVNRVAKMFQGELLKRRNMEEARKKKDKGYEQLLIYFIGASKLTMLYILVNVIAVIAAKALIVGKVALAIATAIALKKAFEHNEKVYEIIKHPHYSIENTHSSSIDYEHPGGFGENEYNYRERRRIYQH